MSTWHSHDTPAHVPIDAMGWARVALRGTSLGLVTFGCLALMLILRLIERPLCGLARPVTPWITVFVCRTAFFILGIRHRQSGRPMRTRGVLVANHASWLDIFALNACGTLYFVSKSEVAGWPGIGWLARATGTLFINRVRSEAKAQQAQLAARLRAGHRLLLFPEGTSTDGRRVLEFKSSLFASFMAEDLGADFFVQPVSLAYHAADGRDARMYGWWGDMEFGAHLLQTLAAPRQGSVEVIWHTPIRVAEHADRKSLAKAAESAVRDGVSARLGG